MSKKQLQKNAKELASFGRHGDDRIIHVSQKELNGLASLLPGGKLPTNPNTGLPEAFFFLPFLAALAPAAAAAPAAATALGTGLAAGAGAATAALPAAAATTAAAAAPTLAAAAPTTAAALGAGTAAAAPATAAALGGTAAAAPTAAATGAATGGGLGSLVAPSTFIGGVPTSAAMPSVTGLTASAPAATAAHALPAAISAPVSTQAELAAAGPASLANPAAATMAGLTGSFPAAPGAATTAGKTGLGALFGGMDTNKLLQYGALGAMMMPKGGGGSSKDDDEKSKSDIGAKDYSRGDTATPPDQGRSGGITPEFNYFPQAHYYAKGGLASLKPQKADNQPKMSDEQLIDATVAALQGQVPNAQAVINMFVQEFGPDALQDLISKIGGGDPNSDGMSDSVPAQVNGAGGGAVPAQLSEGEYIIPSDVVAHLGNGSTQAGAKQLAGMVARTRAARGSPSEGPTQIDPTAMMPS